MAILDDMSAISEEEPLPIIRAYIDLNLLTLHQVCADQAACAHLANENSRMGPASWTVDGLSTPALQ